MDDRSSLFGFGTLRRASLALPIQSSVITKGRTAELDFRERPDSKFCILVYPVAKRMLGFAHVHWFDVGGRLLAEPKPNTERCFVNGVVVSAKANAALVLLKVVAFTS